MGKIYIIRHGQTDWNVLKMYQGKSDIPLNENGVKEAFALSKKFEKLNIDKIYSSPLVRAFDTAKHLAASKNIGVIKAEGLKEIDFGEWEGLSVSQLIEKYPDTYMKFHDAPHKEDFPGEGNLAFVRDRAGNALKEILENTSVSEDIAIVSHGAISKVLIIVLMDLELSFYSKFWLDNTSVSLIERMEKRNRLIRLNDVSHLDNPLTHFLGG